MTTPESSYKRQPCRFDSTIRETSMYAAPRQSSVGPLRERGCKFAPRTISNWPTTAVGAGILSSKLLRRSDYEW